MHAAGLRHVIRGRMPRSTSGTRAASGPDRLATAGLADQRRATVAVEALDRGERRDRDRRARIGGVASYSMIEVRLRKSWTPSGDA